MFICFLLKSERLAGTGQVSNDSNAASLGRHEYIVASRGAPGVH
jgi:hypothetical protein